MQLEEYFDFLGPDVIRVKGHRIGIEDVIERFLQGERPEQIAEEYPGLSLEQVYATITYYLHARAEIDAYLARVRAGYEARMRDFDAREPDELLLRLRAEKARRARSARGERAPV